MIEKMYTKVECLPKHTIEKLKGSSGDLLPHQSLTKWWILWFFKSSYESLTKGYQYQFLNIPHCCSEVGDKQPSLFLSGEIEV